MRPLVPGAPDSSVALGEERARYVREMFSRITPVYDLLNRVLSFGLDQRWRRQALEALELEAGMELLDTCCGTGDLALMASRRHPGLRVTASDFCAPMVARAQEKGSDTPGGPRWLVADSLCLPFPEARFDRATVAFGIRNLGDLDRGLGELLRVLRPGGRLAILEFSTPWVPGFRGAVHFYLRHVLPRIGALTSSQGDAYRYLPETILRFPDQAALVARMEAAGFTRVRHQDLLLGVVAIHVGEKPPGPSAAPGECR